METKILRNSIFWGVGATILTLVALCIAHVKMGSLPPTAFPIGWSRWWDAMAAGAWFAVIIASRGRVRMFKQKWEPVQAQAVTPIVSGVLLICMMVVLPVALLDISATVAVPVTLVLIVYPPTFAAIFTPVLLLVLTLATIFLENASMLIPASAGIVTCIIWLLLIARYEWVLVKQQERASQKRVSHLN